MNASSAWHREVAVSTFNRTWDLLDASARTRDDDAELLTAAFTSRYHWEKAGTAENVAIADNQVARVAAALGHGALAVEFATAALTRTEAAGVGPRGVRTSPRCRRERAVARRVLPASGARRRDDRRPGRSCRRRGSAQDGSDGARLIRGCRGAPARVRSPRTAP
jgi:predicted secreted Zn-dependent protease